MYLKLTHLFCIYIFLKELPFNNYCSVYSATNDVSITPSLHARDLGVLIDSNLNWSTHYSTISQKSKQMCGWIFSVFYTRDQDVMLTLFKSLVRSRLEYCCEVWSPHFRKHINCLEQVQRSFTHRIAGTRGLNY